MRMILSLALPFILIQLSASGHVTRTHYASYGACLLALPSAPTIAVCDAGDLNAYEGELD